jgi:hypothetical protein
MMKAMASSTGRLRTAGVSFEIKIQVLTIFERSESNVKNTDSDPCHKLKDEIKTMKFMQIFLIHRLMVGRERLLPNASWLQFGRHRGWHFCHHKYLTCSHCKKN